MKIITIAATLAATACIGIPMIAATTLTGPSANPCTPMPRPAPTTGYDSNQTATAAAIIDAGIDHTAPRWAWTIAIAAAIDASNLRPGPTGIYNHTLGSGWGKPTQLTDTTHQAAQFYQRLLTTPDWQHQPPADLIATIQHTPPSGSHIGDAITLIAALADTNQTCPTTSGGQLPDDYTIPPGTPTQVVTAILWALAQLGTPYTFGGDCTAAPSGDPAHQCDCSSLMQQAYAAAGIRLPRTTTGQVRVGDTVDGIEDLKPGDLVFIPGSLGTAAKPRHVGMYIGNGLIIQAPHTGAVVRISALEDWRTDIAAIRRPSKG